MDLNKIATHPLQTEAWASFRAKWGNEIIKTDYGLIIVNRLPMGLGIGTFIKGPAPTKKMLADLKKLGEKEKLIFIKLEPNVIKKKNLVNIMKDGGAVPGKTLFTPTSFWIDLTKSEEDLLASFKSKTRYNIRYGDRQGVKVVEDNSDHAFKKYLELTEETTKRQGFYAHTKRYHQLMWKYLRKTPKNQNSKKPIAHLLIAKYRNKVLTTWIIFHWKDFIYYPYGAWSGKDQNLQPNSVMMWEAIKLGKKLGAKTFDLWGREIGKGFTRFKEGFSPEVVEFLGSWDLVINKPLYSIYKIADKIRWLVLRTAAKFGKKDF